MTGPAETAPAPPPVPPRRRRGLWIALVASLAVNLFLVGWVASSYVYGPRFAPGMRQAAPATGLFNHRRAMHALSGSERETARRLWRESFPELRTRIQALRQAHSDMRTAFAADAVDPKALETAVATLKERANAVFDQANATLLKIAAALPASARKDYFNAGLSRARGRSRARDADRPEREKQ